MSAKNSYQLPIDGMDTIRNGAFKGHKWARPSGRHLQKLMREVIENRGESLRRGKQARKDMITKFSMESLAKKMHQRFKKISKQKAVKVEL